MKIITEIGILVAKAQGLIAENEYLAVLVKDIGMKEWVTYIKPIMEKNNSQLEAANKSIKQKVAALQLLNAKH